MELKEIIDGNRLMAEFICPKYRGDGEGIWIDEKGRSFVLIYSTWAQATDQNLFRPDRCWEDLMSIVEKIERIDKMVVTISKWGCQIFSMLHESPSILCVGISKIESTYTAVAEFVRWYNDNQPVNGVS